MADSRRPLIILGALGLLVVFAFCAVVYLSVRVPSAARPRPVYSTAPDPSPSLRYTQHPIGFAVDGHPWIPHLAVTDLDRDGLLDIVLCDGVENSINWIRQAPRGTFTESILEADVKGPAHVEPFDIDQDGDLDLLIASMGLIIPTNDHIGSVIVLENLGDTTFQRHTLIENVARVTDVRAADFDGDGDFDLMVGQFGYAQGEIRWMRNDGNWNFVSEQLLGLSGTIHTPLGDINQDGRIDAVALVSQEWEEIHVFDNLGGGRLHNRIVWGSINEDYGSSGLELADVDQDGDLDIIYTNGDAFDYARPGPRPWHGIQWLENRSGEFLFRRIGDFAGAYSPVCADLDGDGDNDLLAVSTINNWENPDAASMMAWINDGRQRFRPVVLATRPTHLVTAAAADLDGDGSLEIVTGSLHAFPPYDHLSRVVLWKRDRSP